MTAAVQPAAGGVEAIDRQVRAFRFVQAGVLTALLWKAVYFFQVTQIYFRVPLRQRFFPDLFESPYLFAGCYWGACVLSGCLLVCRHRGVRRWAAWAMLGMISLLCIHQGSYNDATFTTAWWAMLWSAWFAGRIGRDDERLIARGSGLGAAIIAMIFLGGAAGKWTPEYWSGRVLYEIYFHDRDFWTFNLLRARLDPDGLLQAAAWYSRGVIVLETACGLTLWMLPPRAAAIAAIVLCLAIVVLSNFLLMSVLGSLIGLAAVGFLVPHRQSGRPPVTAG